jgi:hypothetical protein
MAEQQHKQGCFLPRHLFDCVPTDIVEVAAEALYVDRREAFYILSKLAHMGWLDLSTITARETTGG